MSLIFKKRGCISGQNTVKLSSFYPPEGTTATLPEKGHGLFLYQKASVCQSFVFPSLTVSGKFKKKRKRNFELSSRFHFSQFCFFSTRLALWCEVSEKSIATSPDVAHNFFFFPRLCLPPNQREFAQTFFSRRRTQVYLRLLSILVTFCGLVTGCTTYPSGRTRKSEDFLVLSFPVQCLQ